MFCSDPTCPIYCPQLKVHRPMEIRPAPHRVVSAKSHYTTKHKKKDSFGQNSQYNPITSLLLLKVNAFSCLMTSWEEQGWERVELNLQGIIHGHWRLESPGDQGGLTSIPHSPSELLSSQSYARQARKLLMGTLHSVWKKWKRIQRKKPLSTPKTITS